MYAADPEEARGVLSMISSRTRGNLDQLAINLRQYVICFSTYVYVGVLYA